MGLHATIAVPRWLMRTSDAWPAGERGELAVHGLGLQVGAGVLQNLKSAGIACCPVLLCLVRLPLPNGVRSSGGLKR
jgi:hypothetical protein